MVGRSILKLSFYPEVSKDHSKSPQLQANLIDCHVGNHAKNDQEWDLTR